MKRIVALLSTLLLCLGLVVSTPATAAPKQWCNTVVNDDNSIASVTCKPAPSGYTNWDYCSVTPTNNKLTLYDNQGYCGSSVQFNIGPDQYCRIIPSTWNNWAASGVNYTSENVVILDSTDCLADDPYTGGWIPYQASHPNFYAMYSGINLGNKVSAYYFIYY